MENDTRKELVEYYKWVVSLCAFILTIIVALVTALDDLYFSTILKWGVSIILLSIFFNWLLIKKLVTMPIVEKALKDENQGKIYSIFVQNIIAIKIYGLVQNLSFIVGVLLIFLSFLFGKNNLPL